MGDLAYTALVYKWVISTKYAVYLVFSISYYTQFLASNNLQKTKCIFACSVFHGLTNTLLSMFIIKLNIILIIGVIAMLIYSICIWYYGEAKS